MTLDLHANLGDLFFEALAPCGIVCSYVTYPHVDMKRTAVVASLLLSLQLICAARTQARLFTTQRWPGLLPPPSHPELADRCHLPSLDSSGRTTAPPPSPQRASIVAKRVRAGVRGLPDAWRVRCSGTLAGWLAGWLPRWHAGGQTAREGDGRGDPVRKSAVKEMVDMGDFSIPLIHVHVLRARVGVHRTCGTSRRNRIGRCS